MTPTHDAETAKLRALEIGERLKKARLNLDLTQNEVAERAWISRKSVMNAEMGNVTLENLIVILTALDMAEQLDVLLPPQPYSPIQLLQLRGKNRQRASSSHCLKKQKQKQVHPISNSNRNQNVNPELDW